MTESPHRADDGEAGHRPGLRSSRRPRYLTIAEQLRGEIRDGEHPVGHRMPTEGELCRRFAASRFTIREALRHLEEAGLIERRRGSGTLVRSSEVQVRYEQHIRSIDDLLQFSNATPLQFLHTDRLFADSTLASWLNVRVGDECLHLHGIRHHRRTGTPFCLGEVYRRASWQGLPPGHARMEDALRQLMEHEFEQRIGRIEQALSAVAMSADEADELKVPAATPGFRSVRRYFDLRGRLVLAAVTLHPGPLFSYSIRYQRSDLAGEE
jgi:DNA-binding GntR family transcriptional regulator